MCSYIVIKGLDLYLGEEPETNRLPISYDNALVTKRMLGCKDAKIINVIEELKEQSIPIEDHPRLDKRQLAVSTWTHQFYNNNINGYSMPRHVDSNIAYLDELKNLLMRYQTEMTRIAFKHEENLLYEVTRNCNAILKSLDYYLNGNEKAAKTTLFHLIKNYLDDPFWISDLDKSYAFRGLAPLPDLHRNGREKIYNEMMKDPISFYRARTGLISTKRREIMHIPYRLVDKVKEQRFSLQNQPCLYLGTSSYVCWQECREPNWEEFYISAFRPDDEGKKLKIFNLVASEALANGIWQKQETEPRAHKLQNSILTLLPLVFATSFSVNDDTRPEKHEYIISKLIMQILSELNIDGVAYMSKRGTDDLQYPKGVNLAIPILDIDSKKQYSDICNKFVVTEPASFKDILNNTLDNDTVCYTTKHFPRMMALRDRNYSDEFLKVDNRTIAKEYARYE